MNIIPNVEFRIETPLQTFRIETVFALSHNDVLGYRVTTCRPRSSYLALFTFMQTKLKSKIKKDLAIKLR